MYKMPRVPVKSLLAAAMLVLSLSACDRNARQAQQAFNAYQSASASGDLTGTRDALLKLVAVDEDVADYWMELGKVQLALGAYPDAYYALTRALELNRSSPDLLRVLAQLSLRSDRLDLAEDYARQLDLLAPGDPAVHLTRAIVALQQSNLEEATKQADAILKSNPSDSDARLIQSQVLQRSGKGDEAIALLEGQIKVRPQDAPSHRALAALYEEKGETAKVAEQRRKVWELRPTVTEDGIAAIEASFRAGDAAWARDASVKLLRAGPTPSRIRRILDVWIDHWPSAERLNLARQLAEGASPEQKLEYASFLNRAGAPQSAADIVAPLVGDGPSKSTVQLAGVYAEALVGMGRLNDARRWIDEVLDIDQENVDAIRAAVLLDLKRGDSALAVDKAQRLVTLSAGSANDRLLLARSYQANRDAREAERVLWQAFHDIPADQHVYAALRQYLVASGDEDGRKRMEAEYSDQRREQNLKELVG
jgi:predicted Zn-dependent protease